MQAERILFPTDFSVASDHCLVQASALAHDAGAWLLILHVREPDLSKPGASASRTIEPSEDDVMAMLRAVVPRMDHIPHEHLLAIGSPAEEIVRVAAEQAVDLIIMGTHGRTGARRLLLGSVAESVVRCAPCPVLTLRPQQAGDL